MKKFFVVLLLLTFFLLVFSNWQDKVIYFIMIDRFNDGNPTNNDQGYKEYNPKDGAKFSGGDLEGIIQKIDYIKGLGVDGIWITPPVANQWWDPWVNYGGYHGYWARNFKQVDEHFGTLEDYKMLAKVLHENGMALIQDIVVNHVGNYFRFRNGKFELNRNSIPTSAPTQYPFNLNNFDDPEQKNMNIYHWTEDIKDYKDPKQRLNNQLSGLDDLNTENPIVRKALKDSYKYWIKEVGVDGFRVDTAMYVPKDFWRDFFLSENGIYSVKDNFISFGEVWLTSKPLNNDAEKEISSYFDNGFNAMLDFPLNEEIKRVIKGGQPTKYLAYRLEKRNELLNKGLLVTFIDNHDMERFLNGTQPVVLEQALLFLMTIPGMPVIYYGTEQYFTETRASMFKNGWGSKNIDHFNQESDIYKFLKKAIAFRKQNPATRYGKVKPIYSEKTSGILIYLLESEEQKLLVVMNTANEKKIANVKTDLEEGTILKPIYNFRGQSYNITIKNGGQLSIIVPERSLVVYEISNEKAEVKDVNFDFTVNLENNMVIKDEFVVEGKTNAKIVYIYIDGKYNSKKKIEVEDGKFSFLIDPYKFDPGEHKILFKLRGKSIKEIKYLEEMNFYIDIQKKELTFALDPVNDDKGPFGRYLYPTDPSFKRQMDIVGAKVEKIGSTLILYIKPRNLTTSWNPPNGFDHVTYQIFIDVPTKKGARVLPFQNYEIEDWDYEIFVTGWSSAMYSAEGASAKKFGNQILSPDVSVDNGWVKIIIKGYAFDNPESFNNWKIYITSWDYDGVEARFRPIYKEPKAYVIGGGKETDPYIMDDITLILKDE
ncbi:alpha-amylase family glycosyl hydrolase [Thermosipho atlanticus]|uniref:Alpha-amylase n=1 Tax=Thermosipho atlanticus DSM 15807 TaxID=1123380 RepID=A0A1M5SNQ6_9BACT|nr:alpha-amylase family glycosyl hydrolase [Thermosipho atlanticus]SHH40090.1 Glycosidase [Thermosipho atlanticus DSM 15807]